MKDGQSRPFFLGLIHTRREAGWEGEGGVRLAIGSAQIGRITESRHLLGKANIGHPLNCAALPSLVQASFLPWWLQLYVLLLPRTSDHAQTAFRSLCYVCQTRAMSVRREQTLSCSTHRLQCSIEKQPIHHSLPLLASRTKVRPESRGQEARVASPDNFSAVPGYGLGEMA